MCYPVLCAFGPDGGDGDDERVAQARAELASAAAGQPASWAAAKGSTWLITVLLKTLIFL